MDYVRDWHLSTDLIDRPQMNDYCPENLRRLTLRCYFEKINKCDKCWENRFDNLFFVRTVFVGVRRSNYTYICTHTNR